MTYPAIIDVAVIGVDFGDERGELPRAYVVLDPAYASTVTDVEIQLFLIGKLSRYKALDGGVRRVEALPRSSTGKILKNIFKEAAKQEVLEARMRAAAIAEGGSGDNTLIDSEEERDEHLEDDGGPSVQVAALSAVEEQEKTAVGLVVVEDDIDVLSTSLQPVSQSCTGSSIAVKDEVLEATDAKPEKLAEMCEIEGLQIGDVGVSGEGTIKSKVLVSDSADFAGPSMGNLRNKAATATESMVEANDKLETSGAKMETAVLSDADSLSKVAATVVVTEKGIDA